MLIDYNDTCQELTHLDVYVSHVKISSTFGAYVHVEKNSPFPPHYTSAIPWDLEVMHGRKDVRTLTPVIRPLNFKGAIKRSSLCHTVFHAFKECADVKSLLPYLSAETRAWSFLHQCCMLSIQPRHHPCT